jgi:hypothetical protein
VNRDQRSDRSGRRAPGNLALIYFRHALKRSFFEHSVCSSQGLANDLDFVVDAGEALIEPLVKVCEQAMIEAHQV